jgi:hypothetical protein
LLRWDIGAFNDCWKQCMSFWEIAETQIAYIAYVST